MAAPKYLLGRLLTGAAGEEELVAKMGPDYEYLEPDAPVTIETILEAYGLDKEAEVAEALDVAKKRGLGDIERKLEGWLARNTLKGAQGMLNLGPAGLGPRSTPDTESRITGFLTGETGSIQQQKTKLEAKARQGGRRTRKRKTRKAKKSRRKYK
jgi:hypothetical protein